MENKPYQSISYPSLSQLIEITHNDYVKLRSLLIAKGEFQKFKIWHTGKFILITTQGGVPDFKFEFNPAAPKTTRNT